MEREKKDYLRKRIEHIDITKLDVQELIKNYGKMSFSAREIANAAEIFNMMLADPNCSIWLTLAGSTSAAGCMRVYADMIKFNMVDVVVATGASIVDMDFFEALGFRHYKGTQFVNDNKLRQLSIDRIYDTFIDEDELKRCDLVISKLATELEPRGYSSREFICHMGAFLESSCLGPQSLVRLAYLKNVPIFCPAFSDSSAGFGLVHHQWRFPKRHLSIDSVRDFRELTQIKIESSETGLFMIGGGVPKNFAQDTVVCAEVLGKKVPMHKYAVQITVADVRDGACSSSTLKEASSWGKVETTHEQMVYAEATIVVPLIVAYVYQQGTWKKRRQRRLADIFRDLK